MKINKYVLFLQQREKPQEKPNLWRDWLNNTPRTEKDPTFKLSKTLIYNNKELIKAMLEDRVPWLNGPWLNQNIYTILLIVTNTTPQEITEWIKKI